MATGLLNHGARQELNNYMQRRYGGTARIGVTAYAEGPQHMPVWIAIVTFDQVEIARGTGSSRGEAQENACERALAYLRR
ncbi:hypothetical protein V8B97DRAFT_1992920 [Scleroderma yunnanense]